MSPVAPPGDGLSTGAEPPSGRPPARVGAPPSLVPFLVVGALPPRPAAIPLAEALERSRSERENRHFVQGSLALAATAEEEGALQEARDIAEFGPRLTAASDLPDPRPVAASLGLAIAEILAGVRSPVQVVRWTTPEVYAVLVRRAATVARRSARVGGRAAPRPRLRVLRVRVCCPADGVAEAAIVLEDGPRVRAMALRLTGVDGRWRVEVLQVA